MDRMLSQIYPHHCPIAGASTLGRLVVVTVAWSVSMNKSDKAQMREPVGKAITTRNVLRIAPKCSTG